MEGIKSNDYKERERERERERRMEWIKEGKRRNRINKVVLS